MQILPPYTIIIVGVSTHLPISNIHEAEEAGHAPSPVIQCHVIVVNIVKIRADSALSDTFWNLINVHSSEHSSSKQMSDLCQVSYEPAH